MKKVLALALLCVVGLSTSALADDYTPGSGWLKFTWGGGEPVWVGTEYTFTSTADMPLFKITDAYLSGDQFEVYDHGDLILTTSDGYTTGDSIGGDYDAAYDDPKWSSGSVVLPPGDHLIEILVIANPYSGGGAAFEVTVPEPASLALLALGGLAVIRRR